jgi:Ca2+-binding RTX toxin-like protein
VADIFGTNRKDTLVAENDGDRLFGRGGSDALISEQLNMVELYGGRGNDFLLVTLDFNINDDPEPLFIPNPVSNLLDGGTGQDYLVADASVIAAFGQPVEVESIFHGGAGNDRISATVFAGNQVDEASANNTIHAGSGNDYVEAWARAAGGGESRSVATNHISGGIGNDTVIATTRAREAMNYLDGGDGRDTLHAVAEGVGGGREATNELYGGRGNDHLTATANYLYASDELGGFGAARNLLNGGGGRDVLEANARSQASSPGESALASNDLSGGEGNDIINAFFLPRSH